MKKQRNHLIVLVVLLVLCVCTLPVLAATEGSIEINAAEGTVFEYAKIGTIEDGKYILNKEYKKSGVNLNYMEHSEELERAVKKLNRYMKPEGSIVTEADGKARLKNLSQGIYLLRNSGKATMVSVPTWDEKEKDYIYDVTVIPKIEEVTAPQTNLYSHMKIYFMIIAVLLMCAAMFSYKARKEFQPYKISGDQRLKLKTQVVEFTQESPFDRKIDFEKLKMENPDICGWIYVPDTQIDDPVLIGKTDSEYLYKNFLGEKSTLGSIFGFSDTAKDFSDAHICLFGHNMSSRQMFGELKRYRKEQFVKEHREIYLYTPDSVKQYLVCSVYDCEKTDYTFQHKMQYGSEEFVNLREQIQENNIIEEIENSDWSCSTQILTLASCSDYRETSNRFTVNCILKKSKNNK